ncbi:MAG: GNAT family N-acetyltransferase [Chloroflexota bacterium]
MTDPPAVRIRRATISDDDLATIAALLNTVTPERGADPAAMRWASETYPGGARLLAEAPDGRAVGMATVGRIYVYPAEYDGYWAELAVLPEARRQGLGTGLLAAVSDIARVAAKSALHIPASEARPEGVAFLTDRGFRVHERSKAVRLELGGRTLEPVKPPRGVTLVTLAERPDLVPAIHAVATEVLPDIPGEDIAAGDLAEFRARSVDRPGMPPDGFVIALDEAGVVLGYASVLMEPARPGVGYHDLTAVRRAARGRGIAGALKRATIDWAVGAGLEALEAHNDEDNAAMRAINHRLGYQPLPDTLILRGPLFDGIMGS